MGAHVPPPCHKNTIYIYVYIYVLKLQSYFTISTPPAFSKILDLPLVTALRYIFLTKLTKFFLLITIKHYRHLYYRLFENINITNDQHTQQKNPAGYAHRIVVIQ